MAPNNLISRVYLGTRPPEWNRVSIDEQTNSYFLAAHIRRELISRGIIQPCANPSTPPPRNRYARFPTMCLEETVEAAIYGDAFYDLYSAGGWRYASDDECWDETGAFIHRGSKMAEIPISVGAG